MASRNGNYWTLNGILMAFIDLAIVYTLLCGSAFAIICSKLLSFFGIYLPCPCYGFFGYQNYDLCWHKLLVDWPRIKIMAVEEMIKSRFPFESIMFEHDSRNMRLEGDGNRKFAKGISEVESEACSTSLSGPTPCESIDSESGFEAKGKNMNQKTKSGIRRRKRAALRYGENLPALYINSSDSIGVGVLQPFYDCSGLIRTFSESLDVENGKEDRLPGKPGDSSDANMIQLLEHALEEEKAARAMLYQELEKERAAASSAADEAMAMISRLQEDKASIEMEARQYHRVIEEKCNYDEQEMKILKEMLVRREKEIHFLEKEVEAYDDINFLGNQHVEGDSSYKVNNQEWKLSRSIDSNVNPPVKPLANEYNKESIVYDVHVIDDKGVLSEEDHGKEKGLESGFHNAKCTSDCPKMGTAGSDPEQHCSIAVDGERLKIDNEVEWLRERLRLVLEEKEKIAFLEKPKSACGYILTSRLLA